MKAAIDTVAVRTRALQLLCDDKTQAEVRAALAYEFEIRPTHDGLTRLVRTLAHSRRELLKPGQLRPKRRAKR